MGDGEVVGDGLAVLAVAEAVPVAVAEPDGLADGVAEGVGVGVGVGVGQGGFTATVRVIIVDGL